MRFSHTDVEVPNFDDYRRQSVASSSAKTSDSTDTRKAFSYLMVAGKLERKCQLIMNNIYKGGASHF